MAGSVNQFFEVAREWQKQWANTLSDVQKATVSDTPGLGEIKPENLVNAWSAGLRRTLEMQTKASESDENLKTSFPSLAEQFQQASTTYSSFMKIWADALKGGNGQASPQKSTADSHWMQKMMEPLAELISPTSVPGVMGTEACQHASAAMLDNWLAFWKDLSVRAGEGLASDESQEDKMRHFYEAWLKRYESTIGRFVKFNAVGPARVELEKLSRSTDTYLKYQAAAAEFQNMMISTGVEALQEVMDSSEDIFNGEIVTEENFDQFHQLMVRVGERRFHELFSAPLFCQSLESLINTGLEFHKASNDIAEEALKKTPIVTQSQADEMHREIYLLKKRVSELERQIASVSDAEKGTAR